mgnify:CR=1 FL=1
MFSVKHYFPLFVNDLLTYKQHWYMMRTDKRGINMSKEQIAERLRVAREKAGITQKEAADTLGVTLQAISSYERAVTRIDVESLGVLCALYNTTLDHVINGDDPQISAAAAHFDISKLTPEGIAQYENFIKFLSEKYSK